MARVVYHLELGIILYLKRRDLGHPNLPGLWERLYADKTAQQQLRCWANEQIDTGCPGRMHLRQMPIRGGVVIRQAVHHPQDRPGHVAAVESDKHKALKERMATAASRAGLSVDVESRAHDGRRRTDVLITDDSGHKLGAEAQVSSLTAGTVRKRTGIARGDGITPLWVTNDPKAPLIDRAPWARIADYPWQAYRDRELLIYGGVYRIEADRCDRMATRCPSPKPGQRRCGGWHPRPQLATGVYLDRLIVGAAARDMVDLQDGRNVRWVSVDDRQRYWDLTGGPPDPAAAEKAAATSGDAPTLFEDGPHSLDCGYRTGHFEKAPWVRSREPSDPPPIVPAKLPLVEGQTWADHRRWSGSLRCESCRQPLLTEASRALGVCVRCSYRG